MIDTKKTLATWRAETSSELDEARKALAEAEKEHSAAATDAQEAATEHQWARDTLHAITMRRPGFASVQLAGPLALRLDELKRAASAAGSKRASAAGTRQALVRRVSELEQALAQIDQLTPSADEETA